MRSPQQETALHAIAAWRRNHASSGPQIFRLFGYAGTGKTTLAKDIAETVYGDVAFAAYTGKAALVMRSRGCPGASTLHSLIYTPFEEVDQEGRTRTRFRLNSQGPAAHASLIVVDECSMVNADLARDLLSFGKPVLVLGDPGQLPPIKGSGYFIEAKPDIMLTEIHRQAADNPIVQLATQVRQGKRPKPGRYGASQVIAPTAIDLPGLIQADQILVGRNATRQKLNQRLRCFQGHGDDAPAVGDRLVCLKNDRAKNLLNGGLWTVDEVRPGRDDGSDRLFVTSADGGPGQTPRRVAVSVRREFFAGTDAALSPEQERRSDAFSYGYALTVHKAQGSQWNHVVLFDESDQFKESSQRWLYTALTRAAEVVTMITCRTVG